MVAFRIHPEAEEDLFWDAAWYEDRDPGLGDVFLAQVRVAIGRILEAPERWPHHPHVTPERDPPVRRALVSRFPYTIAYQAFEDEVLVLAVAHAKRHPRYWAARS